nr:hypothetical protein [Desulfobulbaceae bacterium]
MTLSEEKKYPRSLMEIDWADLPVRVSNILLRKAAGYWGMKENNQTKFDGFNEANVVAAIGQHLESSGVDVFYEAEYVGGGDNKCDIYAESWRDEKGIYIEVKLLWEGNEARLNFKNPEKDLFLKDIRKLKSIPHHDVICLFVVAIHSPKNEVGAINSFLDKFVGHASKEANTKPTWSYVNLGDVVELSNDNLAYLHVLCWEI